jgi:hypothetical protein
MERTLRDRRGDLQLRWQAGVEEGHPAGAGRPDVVSSWRRSSRSLSPDLVAAPVVDPDDVAPRWADSRLGRASRIILDDLTDLAASGDMMAAITDDTVTIAWIAGGRTMARRAERVHFAVGGRWAEDTAGTNALALAHHTARPATVFSAEHYASMVHDWVCYSAPILDPDSGRFLGVIDLSTVWQRAHPTLLTTVSALARCVEYELAGSGVRVATGGRRTGATGGRRTGATGAAPGWNGVRRWRIPEEGIGLPTLGAATLHVDGRPVPVTHRQIELLTVLSLHPAGLGLDELTGRVYGDRPVSPSTVKAELSRLRHLLGGRIGSRPYRLVGPVVADHRHVLDALEAGDPAAAVDGYGGPLLAWSESPDVESWRHHLDAAVRDAVLTSGEPDLLWALSGSCDGDAEVQAATLAALPTGDPRHSIVAGRRAAAGSD